MVTNYLALDVGRARIGLAVANSVAQIAAPAGYIANDEAVFTALAAVAAKEQVTELVVGWPRNLQGNATDQTAYVAEFVAQLKTQLPLPIHPQDEALTSVKAEQELNRRGKPFEKGDIDSLSAVYILEDFLAESVVH